MKNKQALRIFAALGAINFATSVFFLFNNQSTETQAAVGNYSTNSSTYYNGISATSGPALLGQLHDLITTTHYTYTTYADCSSPTYVYATDGNPSDANYNYEFYSQANIGIAWGSGAQGTWNREHVWCQSLTGELWGETGGGSDMHHIRPVESGLNSARGNNPFGIVSLHDSSTEKYYEDSLNVNVALGGWISDGTFEPLDTVKGDVARILMYLYTHYNSYTVIGGTTNGSGSTSYFGTITITNIVNTSLGTVDAAWDLLIDWHNDDPVDIKETRRNEACATYQGNRNPFIDNASYANAIWGDGTVNEVTLSVTPSTLSLSPSDTSPLTATMSDSSTPTVTWSSNATGVATVSSSGLVTAIADGSAIITASATVGENTYTGTCAVTVATISAGDYIRVTQINDVVSGDYVLAANVGGTYYALPNTFLADRISGTAITVTSNTITSANAADSHVNLSVSGTSVNIFDGTNYLVDTSSTSFGLSSTVPSTAAWSLSTGTNGTFRLTGSTNTTRGVIFRAGIYNVFGCYATSNASSGSSEYFDIDLFKKGETEGDVVTSLVATPTSKSYLTSDTLQASDFTVSITKNGIAGSSTDYTAKIGSGTGSSFVGSDIAWGTTKPTTSNTTIQFKAKFPTTSGGTTYLTSDVALSVTADSSGAEIVISEAYGGGGNTGATYKQDFVELYNNSSSNINLNGYCLYYASATGTFSSYTSLSGTILAKSYFLIQEAAGSGGTTNIPNADVAGTIAMSATAFKLALTYSTTAPTSASDANVIDFVGAGSTADQREGTVNAPAPSNTNSIARTISDGIAVDTDQNSADFIAGTPTPMNGAFSVADRIMAYEGGDISTLQCSTKYTTIKSQITILTSSSLSYFQSGLETSILNARARYLAWANANNDANPYQTTQGIHTVNINSTSKYLTIIVSLMAIGTMTNICYRFIKKKKRIN
ncbi:MAG: endonuclease [Bacilli bacterium]|jgi:endonuclease I|nr:endonuclease [Bacilli bacterium]